MRRLAVRRAALCVSLSGRSLFALISSRTPANIDYVHAGARGARVIGSLLNPAVVLRWVSLLIELIRYSDMEY